LWSPVVGAGAPLPPSSILTCGPRQDPERFVPGRVLHIGDAIVSRVGKHGTYD
jgi:hypothetical protein